MNFSDNSPTDLPASGAGTFTPNKPRVDTVMVAAPLGTGCDSSDDSRAAPAAVSLPAGPSTPDLLHHLIETRDMSRIFLLAASSQNLSPSVSGFLDLSVLGMYHYPSLSRARCCPSARPQPVPFPRPVCLCSSSLVRWRSCNAVDPAPCAGGASDLDSILFQLVSASSVFTRPENSGTSIDSCNPDPFLCSTAAVPTRHADLFLKWQCYWSHVESRPNASVRSA